MAYSDILMVMLGEEAEGLVQGKEDIISFSPNFSKYSIPPKCFIRWHQVAM